MNKFTKSFYRMFFGKGLGKKIPFIRDAYVALMRKRTVLCQLDGFEMYLYLTDAIVSSDLIRKGEFEPEVTKYFKENLKEDSIFIDAGANIGYYTMLAGTMCKKGKVLSFEPEKDNFKVLERNIKHNGLENVVTYNIALSNKNGLANLTTDKTNYGAASLNPSELLVPSGVQEVETKKLDDLIEYADFVKIDVEGHELEVLKGAARLIENCPNMKLVVEYAVNFYHNKKVLIDQLKMMGLKITILETGNDIDVELEDLIEQSKTRLICRYLLCEKK